jgi:hypothetical protein
MNSLQASENLAARGAPAPRVSLADIEQAIAGEYTTTLDKAYDGCPILAPMKLMTLHTIVLKNGFVVLGKSAPVSAANFDADKGYQFARQDAIQQIWPLMGFALRDRMETQPV